MQPALESQAAVLDIKGKVIDVEGTGSHHLDGLVVAYEPVVAHVDVRNVGRFSYIHTACGEKVDKQATFIKKDQNSFMQIVFFNIYNVSKQDNLMEK